MPVALTIAGSDSGGGAGIQADLKTFHAYGVFGTSALTAITVQNTLGVSDWLALPPALVRAQIMAVVDDLRPAACKTGMLASAGVIAAVAETLGEQPGLAYVLDPVMVATSGDRLLDRGAEQALLERLVPLAALVTPNLDEAALLTGAPVRTVAEMERAARQLVDLGARAALVKGGHLASEAMVDVLCVGEQLLAYPHGRIATSSTHGTGCTLSAAIAAGLARGAMLVAAVESARDYVHRASAEAPGLGRGHGPLNHLVPPVLP
ncbi:MAG: bifunctional hydroxymethylpyrimidine kinase/phosphomethylpyrimidine kinase [Gemmatimonadetes bacterium]|nr:bifunctional hydroxymethylpyrimidine kinase/phosphomethylpyrimidine kinase [Gemmatimonadota bacterium]